MTPTALLRPVTLATLIGLVMTAGAAAQTTPTDPHHPDATSAQATTPSGTGDPAVQGGQPGQLGMMGPGMTGQGAMERMPMMAMHAPMMKIMFAIADTDGDGGLSFEEVSAIHKRIFDKVDANKDGKVVPDEIRTFIQP